MKSFLQSQDWVEFQKQVGRKVWQFNDEKIQANIIRHNLSFGKNYLYVPHGPEILFDQITGGIKNEVRTFVQYLKQLAKENKSIFIKVEPLTDTVAEVLCQEGLKKSKKTIQPQKTVVIDLTKTEDELFKALSHGAQYSLSVAQKSNLEIIQFEPEDFNKIWKLFKDTEKRDKFFLHEKSYYEKLLNFKSEEFSTKLFVVKRENKNIAAAIFGYYKDTVYYFHAAADIKYREFQGPRTLLWHIIKNAKQDGYKYFDLWGIDAYRMPGVTKFKLSFGGRVVEYPGSFDLPISRFWYLMYRIAQKIL
ncbi:MAG: peptidoglycan bridge formation glycyltransferase FemA/FemB family protein [Parcubacteria group bacterium]|nr:peptidoglycan bridge formation glycyltransferase FemA/FemB family protein [Parcubacteria group bacterium]